MLNEERMIRGGQLCESVMLSWMKSHRAARSLNDQLTGQSCFHANLTSIVRWVNAFLCVTIPILNRICCTRFLMKCFPYTAV